MLATEGSNKFQAIDPLYKMECSLLKTLKGVPLPRELVVNSQTTNNLEYVVNSVCVAGQFLKYQGAQ